MKDIDIFRKHSIIIHKLKRKIKINNMLNELISAYSNYYKDDMICLYYLQNIMDRYASIQVMQDYNIDMGAWYRNNRYVIDIYYTHSTMVYSKNTIHIKLHTGFLKGEIRKKKINKLKEIIKNDNSI